MRECLLYGDPALYDLLFPGVGGSAAILDDVRRERILNSERFYVEEAKQSGGPVLELGCGSGRLTIPIAQTGVEISGVDLSESMLETARAKAQASSASVTFLQGDMRHFDLPGRFSAVLIPGNSLLHLLTIEDLKQCLACVLRHLAEHGRLIFDISNWSMEVLGRDPGQRYPALSVMDPTRGEITIEETAHYDSAEQIRNVQWYVSTPGVPDHQRIEYRLRVIFPQELLLLLNATGFQVESRFGEFTREPFISSSPRQVCICTAM
ncbi:MAG: class I SAM-dependent methyltransferase [Acidobacteriota bacterium]|nr:class I SAM-dependent methyltransferase [Acidobacteriota bacterium]